MYLNYKSLQKFLILLILIPIGFFGFVFWSGNMETSSGKASDSEFGKPLLMPFQTSSNVKSVYTVEKKIKLPILMYHRIDTIDKIPKTDKVGFGLRVSPEVFERQLQYLVSKKYSTVNSFQIQDYLNGKSKLPENPVLLTFDDGFKDNYDKAFPLLKKYGMTGDFGIITSVIGTGEYMSLDNLKEMKNAGMGFASHSHSHCTSAIKNGKKGYLESPIETTEKPCSKFAAQDKLTTGQLKYEFGESKKLLEANLGIKVSHLIYPFGFYNQQAKDIAKDLGYTFATTVEPQVDNYTDFGANPYNLERIRVNGQQSGEQSGFFAS
jgi:peptidoglycan/xylan/chitin deacetylase (PgdA/CDA1 family)